MSKENLLYPHGQVEKIHSDLFMVRGSIGMKPLMRITRNMAIIRSGAELTLVNPIRVNQEVENSILELGNITHIMRLGAFHGVDDCYYVEKFGANMWAQLGGTTYSEPEVTHVLSEGCELPFKNAELIEFDGSIQPESVLLVSEGNGLLLTCDAIQNYGDYSYNSFLAKLMMPFIGFPRKTLVGPIWLKYMTPESKSLEPQFRKLLNLPFDSLLAAHGTLLTSGAHQAVRDAIDRAFLSE